MDKGTVGELFLCVLQHMKCIEIRIEVCKALLSNKQKYAMGLAQRKVESAINVLCDLLPDSAHVLKVKKELDKPDLVYVMLLTEKFSQLSAEELEEVDKILEDFIKQKRNLS